jgi:hypothetical protein
MLGGDPLFHTFVIFSIQVAQRHSFLLSSRPPKAALFLLHAQQKRVKVPITISITQVHHHQSLSDFGGNIIPVVNCDGGFDIHIGCRPIVVLYDEQLFSGVLADALKLDWV